MTDSPKRPNIMWLVSEDNSPEFVGPYGDPLANTPTQDRLATGGVTCTFRKLLPRHSVRSARQRVPLHCSSNAASTIERAQDDLLVDVRKVPDHIAAT